jgi:hypothetical protein
MNNFYVWQVGLWLQSLEDIGEINKAHVLLFKPTDDKENDSTKNWEKLQALYPQATFRAYNDEHNIKSLLGVYIPVIRPYVLSRYFSEKPELSEKAVFYCDSDILFTRKPEIDDFLEDDICYLSDTVSYIGAQYLDSKKSEAEKKHLKTMEKKDVLQEMADLVGVDKETVIKNQNNSGGAQYLLKGVTAAFWDKVGKDSIMIKLYLDSLNRRFYESGDKGYQSWCSDMWAVLWNLWAEGKQTKVVREMNFAWATDPVEDLEDKSILHNAGVTGDSVIRTRIKDENGQNIKIDAPAFYKGAFKDGTSPYEALPYLQRVVSDETSKKFCTSYYVTYMLKYKDKLHFK